MSLDMRPYLRLASGLLALADSLHGKRVEYLLPRLVDLGTSVVKRCAVTDDRFLVALTRFILNMAATHTVYSCSCRVVCLSVCSNAAHIVVVCGTLFMDFVITSSLSLS